MALMTPPNNVSPDDATEQDAVVALDEDGNVEEENAEYSGIAAFIQSQFRRSKDRRLADEDRWLMGYRNYRGIYGPEVQFTDTEKSKAFVKITKTKVLAAYAQVIDVLFAGSKFPVGIEPRNEPAGVADAVNFDPNEVTEDKVQEATGMSYKPPRSVTRPELEALGVYENTLKPVEGEVADGPGKTPTTITFEPAKKAAMLMERNMHDQLTESDASKHLRSVAFEA